MSRFCHGAVGGRYDASMRGWVLVLTVCSVGCTITPGIHGGGVPVSWSTSTSDSPGGRATVVCEHGKADPCVLERGTTERPRYTTFALHLWGPKQTRFTGSFLVGFLDDPDPRRYKSDVDLTTDGREIHQRVFSKLTTLPGTYHARIRLEETSPGLPQPRTHELTVPVTVR